MRGSEMRGSEMRGSDVRVSSTFLWRCLVIVASLIWLVTPAHAQPANDFLPAEPATSLDVPYPQQAKGDATVVLELSVSDTGAVRSVRVVRGDEPFATAAKDQASNWKFKPATSAGTPIGSTFQTEVTFHDPNGTPTEVT